MIMLNGIGYCLVRTYLVCSVLNINKKNVLLLFTQFTVAGRTGVAGGAVL